MAGIHQLLFGVGGVYGPPAPDVGDTGRSLRVRGAAGAYLSRTFGTPTSTFKCLLSFWYKPGAISSGPVNVTPIGRQGTVENAIHISGTGAFGTAFQDRILLRTGGANKDYWTPVFRDPTSWYHIVLSFDTTQAVQANRARGWVNGVEMAKGSNGLALNETIPWNVGGQAHTLLSCNYTGYYGDAYFSRFVFLDGKCVQDGSAAVSDFGYSNTEINEWVSETQSQVKAVADAGGTNSFMLDFDDGASLASLGYDKSVKGNNWALNSFSLAAGSTYDWMLDAPGNSYATLNPLIPFIPSAANIRNGNLMSSTTAARATMNSTTFDSQWFVTAGSSNVTAGVIDDSGATNTTSVTANKVFAFKMTAAGALSYKNVTDAGSWTSIATGLTGNHWPYCGAQTATWNFGQQPLPEPLDTGFKTLCQANLPDNGTVTLSGTFAGNASADGPFVWMNGTPATLSIDGSANLIGTSNVDKLAGGFKLRSATHNATGTRNWVATISGTDRQNIFKYNNAKSNP